MKIYGERGQRGKRMDLNNLDLHQLLELLDDLDEKRTPVGWSPDDAVVKAGVERRIMELVMAAPNEQERRDALRVPCDLPINLITKRDRWPGTVLNLGTGGAFVKTSADLPEGADVNLEIRGTEERGLRARGQVAWRRQEPVAGLGISFAKQPSPPHERRLRRFVMELLRHRVEVQH